MGLICCQQTILKNDLSRNPSYGAFNWLLSFFSGTTSFSWSRIQWTDLERPLLKSLDFEMFIVSTAPNTSFYSPTKPESCVARCTTCRMRWCPKVWLCLWRFHCNLSLNGSQKQKVAHICVSLSWPLKSFWSVARTGYNILAVSFNALVRFAQLAKQQSGDKDTSVWLWNALHSARRKKEKDSHECFIVREGQACWNVECPMEDSGYPQKQIGGKKRRQFHCSKKEDAGSRHCPTIAPRSQPGRDTYLSREMSMLVVQTLEQRVEQRV